MYNVCMYDGQMLVPYQSKNARSHQLTGSPRFPGFPAGPTWPWGPGAPKAPLGPGLPGAPRSPWKQGNTRGETVLLLTYTYWNTSFVSIKGRREGKNKLPWNQEHHHGLEDHHFQDCPVKIPIKNITFHQHSYHTELCVSLIAPNEIEKTLRWDS